LGILLLKTFVNGTKSGSCIEDYLALSKVHNTVLFVALEKLRKHIKGFKYSYINFFDVSFEIINNPSKFGRSFHIYYLKEMLHGSITFYSLRSFL
jgi:hypothetical protein